MALSLCCAMLSVLTAISCAQDADDKAAHTKVGDTMPAISVQETSGETFSVAREAGKVVVVNFWATWCAPCMVEMPLLEKTVWEKHKSQDFVMVAVAREQDQETVSAFQKKHPAFTFPMASDPKRSTYSIFADSGIPRTYVVDRHGRIVYQSLGYSANEVDNIGRAIDKALAAK
jgi:thiol-disulfide isomerase/thioredoxin